MTITLICAFCGRQQTYAFAWLFQDWWEAIGLSEGADREVMCSLSCLASWAMREELRREAVGGGP